MARTLVQIRKQIDKLQNEAERVRANEVAGVVQRIKIAIDFYGLKTEDLFGAKGRAATKGKKTAPARKKAKAKKVASPAKYRDKETNKTWTGHGKRPGWFVHAIESGIKAEDMAA